MIARSGRNWIVTPLIIGVFFSAVSIAYQNYVAYVISNLSFLSSVALIFLYRDPPRTIGRGVVSPADGRVVRVDTKTNSLSIKTGVANVHIVRAPLSGRVLAMKRTEKAHPDSPQATEGLETRIASRLGIVRVLMSSRPLTNGVRSYVKSEENILKGQKIGIITPMALVTLELPDMIRMSVDEGDKVKAGETTVAIIAKTRRG